MNENDWIRTKRACDVVQIPYGNTITLPEKSEVKIAQELGGYFTVVTPSGFLLRVEGRDADALGREVLSEADLALSNDEPFSEERVVDVLCSCYDPEIPINIVDLGLIYNCEINALEDDEHEVWVQMTLTAPGCGMADILKEEIEHKLRALRGVKKANVEIVFDPPWDPSLMSEAALLATGLM